MYCPTGLESNLSLQQLPRLLLKPPCLAKFLKTARFCSHSPVLSIRKHQGHLITLQSVPALRLRFHTRLSNRHSVAAAEPDFPNVRAFLASTAPAGTHQILGAGLLEQVQPWTIHSCACPHPALLPVFSERTKVHLERFNPKALLRALSPKH